MPFRCFVGVSESVDPSAFDSQDTSLLSPPQVFSCSDDQAAVGQDFLRGEDEPSQAPENTNGHSLENPFPSSPPEQRA